ncbi:DNA-directed RNA polymerase III subunit RPC8 isoform X2 [Boleophthalmus pectinirostris]|uniref:DNA-directed RNA polymerase III subunit RPC8 isoform X2 n=1 Tax=Boleophthalmus pectinirostris TaxID=150288 RepID=UPI002432149C|nr:DNA-directed RNA polymerase III subunit RPC8 isoform X2 [Boleophthalmus pectinirostris]
MGIGLHHVRAGGDGGHCADLTVGFQQTTERCCDRGAQQETGQQGDGASHTKVHFRYVVFHPFLDEVLVGKIKYCSQEGVHVTMGFFDDILIPPESLQQPAKFDEAEQVWLWEYETDEGAHDLYMDQGEEIRFRVTDEVFVDTSPTGPATVTEDTAAQPGQSTAPPPEAAVEKKEAPYTLIGTISEPGLGLLSWWNN